MPAACLEERRCGGPVDGRFKAVDDLWWSESLGVRFVAK
jgi:hypothetical protein